MFGCSISTPRGEKPISVDIGSPRGEIRLIILYISQYCGTEKHERMENAYGFYICRDEVWFRC